MNVLSLFSGCGGMDIGIEGGFQCLQRSINETLHPDWIEEKFEHWVKLKKTGFETVFANDIRPDAKAAWEKYFSSQNKDMDGLYHLESIVDIVKRAKAGEVSFPKDIDLLTGGFPCQDFSLAGKRNGFFSQKSHTGGKLDGHEAFIESRGQLYLWMREVVSLTKPFLFVAENVKGLTSLRDAKKVIEKNFAQAAEDGYLILPAKILHAADYGVPQSRERVFFFGFRKNVLKKEALKAFTEFEIPEDYDPYPIATHAFTHAGGNFLSKPVTCAEALDGLAEPENSSDLSQKKYSKAKFMGTQCQGQTEIKMDSIAPTIRSEHHGNIEFRRLSKQHGGQHLAEIKQNLPERRLSIRECARLQTFPDSYQFILQKTDKNVSVSASDAYKIIGNAVPCVLAYNIAMNIKNKWNSWFVER